MLSLGMLFAFAFAITSRNFELVAGSGPPAFTATASSLPIFVKIFPLTASVFAFLFLIVDHLLCPDIFAPLYFHYSNIVILSYDYCFFKAQGSKNLQHC